MVDGSIAPDARPSTYIDHRQSSPKAGDATPWIDHIKFVFGDDDARGTLLSGLRTGYKHPDQKVNHALVFGGMQGVGKDTLIEPVKAGRSDRGISRKSRPSKCSVGSILL